jgi:hypothetical protein
MKRPVISAAVAVLLLFAGIAAVAYYLEAASAQSVGYGFLARLWNMPVGLGALIGAFLGLLAMVFGALYHAQLVRESDARRHTAEARALAGVLAGELSIGYEAFKHQLHTARGRLDRWQSDAREKGVSTDRVRVKAGNQGLYPAVDLPILQANAHRLPILGNGLAAELAEVHAMSVRWQRLERSPPVDSLSVCLDEHAKLVEQIEDVEHVLRRIEGFAQGLDFPVPLAEHRRRRRAMNHHPA